ncbi:MAG: hypothetical protein J2P25_18595 [Nocardiopsaceae bacterium]|nr:hypothetical protein [Nocardiopsaceae bacterium]
MRTVVRTLIAALLFAAPLLPVLEAPASAQAGNLVSRTDHPASHSLTVSIDSVSPDFATPGSQVTVRGTVTNATPSPITGLQIAMQTSPSRFTSRSEMDGYASSSASNSGYLPAAQVGTPYAVGGTLHSGSTLRWSVSFPASTAGYTQFGVYPLQAVVYDASSTQLATDRTLLPYWPGGGNPANPMSVAWIWPLVDEPHQRPCPQTLTNNGLARGLESSGRLGGLLSAGLRWAGKAKLTWAVDPALLSDARTMTAPYKVGGNAACTGTTVKPASKAAATWLYKLRTDAAGLPMFVTPYADVDASALAHAGLATDLKSAFTLGDQVAGSILQRPFGKNGAGTGDGGVPSVAWQAGGTADEDVLTSLANAGIDTTVLGGNEDPSVASAASTTTSGIGTTMRLLDADSGLTDLLGTSGARSSAGQRFATEQDFLAETAMIVAEAPFAQGRSAVIAPPRRWAPSAAEASALLSETTRVPWLRPATLASVASSPSGSRRLPGDQPSGAELSPAYMNSVRSLSSSLRMYQNLLSQPSQGTTALLESALAAAQSTAWRGSRKRSGKAVLGNLADFVRYSERKVQIITGKKFLLAGTSGDIAVSVRNGMSLPVQVRIQATVPGKGQLSIGGLGGAYTIDAGKTQTVKVPVHSTGIETTTVRLQLVTRDGRPLPWTRQPMTVQVTRYGRELIILIGAALGVLVLTAGTRWVRQWLNDTRPESQDDAESGGIG